MRIGMKLMEVLESIQKPFDPKSSDPWPAASFEDTRVQKLRVEGLVDTYYFSGSSAYEAIEITDKGIAEYERRHHE
ncbi:hypothetical protein [Tumebacillus flagellatus]|uniref:Uncharacterized protein n=1 Tax=Tumebacillus flagellatus TaxID=1157490 RepID=A0A074LW65_9BACL|nr:hypothetical protein [Tumebacillus flagellatus]KEO84293.1 hypothetical protein EL26_05870 [Tumebacillus flagellatus]